MLVLKTVTDLKRATPVGARVHVENYRRPQATGDRTILKAQTKSWKMTTAESLIGTWLDIPKRDTVVFDGTNTVTFLETPGGVPWLKMTVLDSEESSWHPLPDL